MSNLASPKTGCASAKLKQAWLCSRFALFFETRTQSRTAEQAERRIKRSLNYAEAKPALAAEQQQYAPSFSLSAPCILLTLTRRLRFISNPYFDTPSPKAGKPLMSDRASGSQTAPSIPDTCFQCSKILTISTQVTTINTPRTMLAKAQKRLPELSPDFPVSGFMAYL